MATSRQTIVRGAYGRAWFNGAELATVEELELSTDVTTADHIQGNGHVVETVTSQKSGGTLKFKSIDSLVLKEFLSVLKSGKPVYFDLAYEIDDPSSLGKERCNIQDCQLKGKVPIGGFKRGDLIEKTLEFSFQLANMTSDEVI